jgi:uncharacterized protein
MRYLLLLISLLFFNALQAQQEFRFSPKEKSKEAIYLFRNGKFEALYNKLSPEMKRYLDVEKLQGFWDGLEMRNGSVKEVEEATLTYKDSFAIVLTPIHFEKRKLGIKLVYNQDAEIAGLYIDAPSPQYRPAAYVDASRFYEYKKVLPDPKFPADAVLSIPAKGNNFPLVIIVGGSGTTDKDLTMGPNRIYKDLAWGLSNQGVAVLRYDKRTLTHGAAMAAQKEIGVKEEYLDDLQLALKLAKSQEGIDTSKIFVLGHSEGGYLIPYFEKNLKGIAGYISLAGSYSNMADLICVQLKYLQAHTTKNEAGLYVDVIKKAEFARDHLKENSPKDSMPLGLSPKYLCQLNEISPAKLISYISNKPLLFLQGGRDYQVPPSELEKWKAALSQNRKAEFIVFPSLNHLALSGEGESLPAEYQSPGNVPEEVIDRILRFVLY